MAVVTKAASSHTAVTTGWTSPSNAFATSADGVFATAAPAKNATVNGDFGFAFALSDFGSPGSASAIVIDQIVVTVAWKVSTATSATLGVQLRNQNTGTLLGTETTDTTDTTVTNKTQTITSGISATELINGQLAARIRDSRGNTNTAHTGSLDFVKVDVTYHLVVVPAAINATSAMTASLTDIAAPKFPSAALYGVPRTPRVDVELKSRAFFVAPPAGGTKSIAPAAINASSSMTASVSKVSAPARGNALYAVPRESRAEVLRGSRVFGPIATAPPKSVVPAAINATSSVTATVAAIRAVKPVAITATSAVTAGVVTTRAIKPASITATSPVTAAVTAIHAVKPAAITATSAVTATLSKVSSTTPRGSVLYAVPRTEREEVFLGSRSFNPITSVDSLSFPSAIAATSTVTASVSRRFLLGPVTATATSSITAAVGRPKSLAPSAVLATSTITGSVVSARVMLPAPPTFASMTATSFCGRTMSAAATSSGTMSAASSSTGGVELVPHIGLHPRVGLYPQSGGFSPASPSTGSMVPA